MGKRAPDGERAVCEIRPSLRLNGHFSGRLFGLLYWWVGTTWYRLTTAASLLDVFVLTR